MVVKHRLPCPLGLVANPSTVATNPGVAIYDRDASLPATGMKPREIFLASLCRQAVPRLATGSATSVVTTDLMNHAGVWFPEAHLDAKKWWRCQKPPPPCWASTTSCRCSASGTSQPRWAARSSGARRPHARLPHAIWSAMRSEPAIPRTFSSGCAPCRWRRSGLQRRPGDEVAIAGKVFGPWTLGYHVFGVEEFLMHTLLEPDQSSGRWRAQGGDGGVRPAPDRGRGRRLCLADHCTRDLCSPDAYREFLMDVHAELVERLPARWSCTSAATPPTGSATSARPGWPASTSTRRCRPRQARTWRADAFPDGRHEQPEIIRKGTRRHCRRMSSEKIAAGIDVIGPECAVPLDAPWINMRILAEEAKRQSAAKCHSCM